MGVGQAILGARTATIFDGVDFSADFSQVALNFTNAEIDVSTFGTQGWKRKITSISDGTIDYTGFGQSGGHTLDAKLWSMLGAPINPNTVEVDYPTSAVGGVRVTMNCYLKSFKSDLKVEDAYRVVASVSVTGAPTRALITS